MKLVETLTGFDDRASGRYYGHAGIRFKLDDDRASVLAKAGLVKIIEHNVGPSGKAPPSGTKAARPPLDDKSAGAAPEDKSGAALAGADMQQKADIVKADIIKLAGADMQQAPQTLGAMNKGDLLELASGYGIDVPKDATKADIIKLIDAKKKER